jgi:hypothetical protein
VVKRTIRPPEDPNRQVGVSITGDQATVTLDAASGAQGTADRQYVNYLPVSASIVDPQGMPIQVQLPQVAPGEYKASLPATTDGVYTLQVTENESDGSQSTQSSGFVVPYSPEYRDLSTNDALLSALTSATGGHAVQTPDDAFEHDLPAVGAPRPIWPYLLAALVLVLVADVGVRRLRLSVFEIRSGYQAVRSRLGYTDDAAAASTRRRATPIAPSVPLIASAPGAKRPQSVATMSTSASRVPMSQQLLAAKKRAAKR